MRIDREAELAKAQAHLERAVEMRATAKDDSERAFWNESVATWHSIVGNWHRAIYNSEALAALDGRKGRVYA